MSITPIARKTGSYSARSVQIMGCRSPSHGRFSSTKLEANLGAKSAVKGVARMRHVDDFHAPIHLSPYERVARLGPDSRRQRYRIKPVTKYIIRRLISGYECINSGIWYNDKTRRP